MKILITGATGFIGKRLAEKFSSAEHELYILVRRQSLEKAQHIFEGKKNIHYIIGDVSHNDVLETMGGVETLPEDIEAVIHLAAIYDLEVSLSQAYANNVVGTQNVIYLIQRMKKVKFYHHISTYAVSGSFEGDFKENQIEPKIGFPDFYSRTKMQAEYLVRNALLKETKVKIYRPGIIIGDSLTGEMDKVDGPYHFFRLFSQIAKIKDVLPLNILPLCCHAKSTVPMLPVDIMVDWLFEMISHPTKEKLTCYHLVPDEKIFVTDFVTEALKEFDLNLKIIRVPLPGIYARILPLLKIPKELLPYIRSKTSYNKSQMKKDFPHLKAPLFRDYLPVIVEKAKGMFL